GGRSRVGEGLHGPRVRARPAARGSVSLLGALACRPARRHARLAPAPRLRVAAGTVAERLLPRDGPREGAAGARGGRAGRAPPAAVRRPRAVDPSAWVGLLAIPRRGDLVPSPDAGPAHCRDSLAARPTGRRVAAAGAGGPWRFLARTGPRRRGARRHRGPR